MAQHDFVIANQGFPATRADINNFLQAVATTHSGTSTPSGAVAGTIWLDTTTATAPILKYYDGTDNITLATIDHVANTVNFSDSAFDLITDTTPQLGGNLDVNGNSIVSTSNGNITLTPNGTGDVVLSADTVKIGDSNANATITTDGTGDLILNTNSGTTSGSITIADGANGDITIAGNGTGQIIVNAGAVGTPTIAPTGDTNTGIFFPAADTIAFTEGGTEAMRIDSSGNVGIKATSISFAGFGSSTSGLQIDAINAAIRLNGSANGNLFLISGSGAHWIYATGTDPMTFSTNGAERMRIDSSGDVGIGTTAGFTSGNGLEIQRAGVATLRCDNSTSTAAGEFRADATGTAIDCRGLEVFRTLTGGTERMRINSSGNIFVGKTSSSEAVAGCELFGAGLAVFVRDGDKPMVINRNTNDGTLIEFKQANAVEGSISVSGTTVTYGGFTGSHWSRFIDEQKPDVLRGTVMESLDQMVNWYAVEFEVSTTENDEVKTHTEHKPYALKANEQEGDVINYNFEGTDYQATIVKEKDVKHMMSKISNTVEAKNVYGVFSAWDNDDLINNDFYVASVGSYVVRIKAGQTVSKGDLLQSNGDGTAKVQADDLVRASSFAKVLSNTVIDIYEDGSFIVPCSLMC